MSRLAMIDRVVRQTMSVELPQDPVNKRLWLEYYLAHGLTKPRHEIFRRLWMAATA